MPDTFVLDCSIAAKWLLPEPGRAAALRILEQYTAREIHLIAPDILLAEFASLLAKRSRRKQISTTDAQHAYTLMTKCVPRLFDIRPRLFQALELSMSHQMSLWDCLYLDLAIEHDCPVLTADLRFFRAAERTGLSVRLLQ
jgi:predicted nucleic acid-binding protein